MTSGSSSYRSEIRATLRLAGPIVVTQLAHISLSFVDTIMVGRLGPEQLAGVALANTMFFTSCIFCMGVLMAVGPMVSQAFGARTDDPIGRSVRQGLWLTLILAGFAFFVIWNADSILLWAGQSPADVERARSYLHAIVWGVFPFLAFVALRSFLEAVSRPRVVTAIAISGVGLNAFLNYTLMYGRFGFPEMGLEGTGWASASVYTFNFAAVLVYTATRKEFRSYRIFSRLGRPDPDYFRELFRIGWPIGASLGIETSLFMITVMMMGWISTTALAAHQVAIQCAAFTFMVPLGIGMATSVRVGYAVGARNPEAARKAGNTGMALSAAFMGVAAMCFWLIPERIIGLYLDRSQPANAAVISKAVILLGVAAIFQVVDGLQASVMGALRGLKDTRFPMVICVFSYWGIGLVSGYLLAFQLGYAERGLWWGLVCGLMSAAFMLTRRFRKLVGSLIVRRSRPVADADM